MKFRGLFIIIFVFLVISSSAFASTVANIELGPFSFNISTPGVGVERDKSPVQWDFAFEQNGKEFVGGGEGPGFTFTYSGNTDPLINWGFSATAPGAYHVIFYMPVVGGPYDRLKNMSGVTISDNGGNFPTSASNINIKGQVPAGNTVAGVTLMNSIVQAPSNNFNQATMGPISIIQNFGFPSSMAVDLSFNLASVDNDGSAAFTGQLSLTKTPIPEPASLTMLGIGLLGLAAFLRRRSL
jgi:hypothetical protein